MSELHIIEKPITKGELNKIAGAKGYKSWEKLIDFRYFSLLLIPLSLLGVFAVFKLTLGNFFAYFNSGDNIHLFFPPFQIFNYAAPWVGTLWLEEIIFVYLFGIVGISHLYQKLTDDKNYAPFWFTLIFFSMIFFVSHRDIIRYALPVVPFLILGFSDFLLKKEFKYLFLIIIIPIYLFSLSYISQNIMPISDWTPLL